MVETDIDFEVEGFVLIRTAAVTLFGATDVDFPSEDLKENESGRAIAGATFFGATETDFTLEGPNWNEVFALL